MRNDMTICDNVEYLLKHALSLSCTNMAAVQAGTGMSCAQRALMTYYHSNMTCVTEVTNIFP